ncbi:MAG: AMP-binding protein, partial [Lachnospiraceae bacterium]|nr:AMP-binding protein [Lachnospiraceae bacterium]
KLCLLEETFDAKTIPSLRAVFCCGERLEKKTVRKLFARFPDIAMINAYGPTEATCAVCAVQITREMLDADAELPVGDPANAATEIYVNDSADDADSCESGDNDERADRGEIVLRGASVFSGYLDGRAGGHFTSGGVNGYRTGDGGFLRDGLLYCTGRRDNQIKYKGYRIETDEIECRILRLPGVAECAVVAPVNEAGIVKTIRAYVVADAAESCSGALAEQRVCGELTADEVRKGLAETLPPYMIPKTIEIVGSLPRNKNGKIDRKALVEL